MSQSMNQTALRALLPASNIVYEQILKDVTAFEEDLRMLELARKLVPFVIAAGVLTDRDGAPWSELISPLADIAGGQTRAEQHKEHLIASLEKLLPASKETHDSRRRFPPCRMNTGGCETGPRTCWAWRSGSNSGPTRSRKAI
jgi:hypothetical protein